MKAKVRKKAVLRKKKFYDYKRDGVTQSLLITWMTCRMRAKWFLEGWSSGKVRVALTFGTIVHGVLEHVYNLVRKKKITRIPNAKLISKIVKRVERQWLKENPGVDSRALEDLDMCCLIAEATLPEYFRFWWKKDSKEITWQRLEQKFSIPFVDKKGRKTLIRGKKDGVFGDDVLRLFETKTKSKINLSDLMDTLFFEFQVCLYLWAVKRTYKKTPKGVYYNIIRRSSLRKKKGESKLQFKNRIAEDVKKRPRFYFVRLKVAVTKKDMAVFESEFENIITEYIDWCEGKLGTYKNTSACSNKYGKCSSLGLCSKQDFSSYKKRKVVFRELEDM